MADLIATFEAMLARGTETPVLRFGLGKACLDGGRAPEAVHHLQRAVELQPDYSAAWKLLGKALAQAERGEEAADAYTRGIAVAEARGDIQAVKEMRVFLNRLRKPG